MATTNGQEPTTENKRNDSISTTGLSQWEKITGFAFGLVFISVLLILSVLIEEPSPSQYATFKTVLALAAAGIGGILAGVLYVEGSFQKWVVRAGGALALFVIVYFFTPAPSNSTRDKPAVFQEVEEGARGAIHMGEGNIIMEQRR